MDYTINLTISDQSLSASNIVSVNGTVAIIGCTFDFDATWDAFPARQAIFKNSSDIGGYVAAIGPSGCLVPWEVLKKAGTVSMAIVGTNTDGQVQRTNTIMVVCQTRTLQGGVNSIDPTPDQYAQFIADVEEMIGQAGVLSVNGMTGDVTLTASDVGALADTVTVPTRTSQLTNDSGFLTAIPSQYVTDTELATALLPKANTSDLAAVATTGNYNDLSNKPTIPTVPVQSVNGKTGAVVLTASDVNALPSSTAIPTKTSDLTNDSNFVSDSSYVHTDNNFTTALLNKLNGIASGAEVNVQSDWNATSGDALILNKPSIPTKTSDLTNDSGFITSAPVSSVNGQTGNVTLTIPTVVSSVTTGGTDAINSVALIAYINSLDADNTEY